MIFPRLKCDSMMLPISYLEERMSLRGPCVISLALALAALIGILNYVTGRDVAMSAFYLVPICWASWVAGRRAGLLLATVCTVLWFIADLKSGYLYWHLPILYWNALMLLALPEGLCFLAPSLQSKIFDDEKHSRQICFDY